MLLDWGGEDLLGGFLREGLDERDGVAENETIDLSRAEVSGGNISSLVIKSLQDNNGVLGDGESVLHIIGGGDEEGVDFVTTSDGEEGFCGGRFSRAEISNNDDFIGFLSSKELGSGIDGLGSWSGLLLQPGNNVRSGSAGIVLDLLAILEEGNGGESFDGELLGQTSGDGCVNFGKFGRITKAGKISRSFVPFRC
jgi:hypothetical protein